MQYIGMTERRLQDRVKEHLPRWLLHDANTKETKSSITEHIMNYDHKCDSNTCFKVLFRCRQQRLLKFTEAVCIRLLKPQLNIQREFQYQLRLPWS